MDQLLTALTDRWARYKFSLNKVEIKCVSGENNPLFLRLEAIYEGSCIGFLTAAFMSRHFLGDIPEREVAMQLLKERYGKNEQDKLVYFADIFVETRFRNCGVGRALYTEAVRQVSCMMGERTTLLGITQTEQATNFLRRCGLNVIGASSLSSIMIAEI